VVENTFVAATVVVVDVVGDEHAAPGGQARIAPLY
jgi:hypothetical protein